jgi:hypothetical protein
MPSRMYTVTKMFTMIREQEALIKELKEHIYLLERRFPLMRFIIVNGEPEVGKDTFVDDCVSFLHENQISAFKLSSIDYVKYAAKVLGWNGEKDDKGRKFLSKLKEMSDELYDGSFTKLQDEFSKIPENSVVFIFIREPKNIERFKHHYLQTITVIIRKFKKEFRFANVSDFNVYNYKYDHEICNTGTKKDLKSIAKFFCMDYIMTNLKEQ